MRTMIAICMALLATGCANRLDPVFDGGVYDPIYGAAGEGSAERG